MGRVLRRNFFGRYTPIVARDLLGKFLVRKKGRETKAFLITEVEAYTGRSDISSHARMGPTKRNRAMFGVPGRWYVYFIYGMYHCLNIVTEREGVTGAVLIRGVAALTKGEPRMRREDLISGPGKLCKELMVKLSHYGKPSAKSSGLWIEDRGARIMNNESLRRQGFGGQVRIKDKVWKVKRTPRINVSGGEIFKKRPWRFILLPRKSADEGPLD